MCHGAIFAWGAAAFLLLTGAFLLWQGRAQRSEALPPAPQPRVATPFTVIPPTLPEAPASTPKTREQKRFARADKDDDGRITAAECSIRGARRSPSSTPTAMAR